MLCVLELQPKKEKKVEKQYLQIFTYTPTKMF